MNRRQFLLGSVAIAATAPALTLAQTPVATPYVVDKDDVIEAWGRVYQTEEVDAAGSPFLFTAQGTIFADDADAEALTVQMVDRFPKSLADDLGSTGIKGPESLDVESDSITGDLKAYSWVIEEGEQFDFPVAVTAVTVTDGPRSLILVASALKDIDPADVVAVIEPSFETWDDTAESLIPPVEDLPPGFTIRHDQDVTESVAK